jgi:hypothetical protein
MNISTLIHKIENYETEIVDSGFSRDIQGYISTLSQPQNNQNIVLLKEITSKIIDILNKIIDCEIENDLQLIIVTPGIPVFKSNDYKLKLTELLNDPKLNTSEMYANLNSYLSTINSELTAITNELIRIKKVFYPYYEKDKEKHGIATISVNFRDEDTISNLKQFSKSITRWEKYLKIFHQLISSETPKDIELVNIQNGSLDVVLNINIDIAFNFAEIVKYCLIAFGGFLSYKKLALPITKSYLGNKQLEDLEKDKERLMLENIGKSVKTKLLQLHQERHKTDPKINDESIDKKIEQVAGLITEHIIKGNDIELLVDYKGKEDIESKKRQEIISEIETNKLTIKRDYRELSKEDKILLLETYKAKEE